MRSLARGATAARLGDMFSRSLYCWVE